MDQPKETCSTCRFFQTDDERTGNRSHACRRYPPDSDGWPSVNPNDWCGEFKANEALRERQRKEFHRSVAEVRSDAEAEYWQKIAEENS